MARSYRFQKVKGTYETDVLHAVINKKATTSMLEDVYEDIQKHLNRPCGTLANYHGRFTNDIIEPLQKNYRLFPSNEAIVEMKVMSLVDSLMKRMLKGSSIRVHTSMVNLIIDYLKGRDNSTDYNAPQFVVVGYPTAKDGVPTLPCPKTNTEISEIPPDKTDDPA